MNDQDETLYEELLKLQYHLDIFLNHDCIEELMIDYKTLWSNIRNIRDDVTTLIDNYEEERLLDD